MISRDITVTLPWLGAGTERLVRLVDALPDDAFAAPSALPDWTRAHVVGHLARNAEALTRLATWARTGVETPMYADPDQRARDIETSAKAPAATLRRELVTTAADLAAALAELDDRAWQAPVRSALGRAIPAVEIPWLRVREVWLHALDLDGGAAVADLPAELVDALLDDVTAALSRQEDCPAVLLLPTDRHRAWTLGPPGDARPVHGSAAELLAWSAGRVGQRDSAAPVDPPVLPRWI